MCTLTWSPAVTNGYSVWFNRDELRTRLPALPPRVRTEGAISFIAPIDGDAGGTWIAVNARGLTVCLLNHFAADAARPAGDALDSRAFVSRGHLVLDLMACSDLAELRATLGRLPLRGRFRPFDLVALDPSGGVARLIWDGAVMRPQNAQAIAAPISSSGFRPAEVAAVRARTFAALVPPNPDESALEAFHRSHLPERGGLSVCMHRPEARTVSLSHIRVMQDRVAFRYGDGPACQALLGPPVMLGR